MSTTASVGCPRALPKLGAWSLFWSDRHGRWHRYDFAKPSLDVGVLLAEVERDPTSIFWG